ncbi:MAG: dicarboxylate/amino acid:cation symporter [Firmicutes bacterium]|nr:dicarboxylate/amino acid:cation symporter [Bacillota bacterium]
MKKIFKNYKSTIILLGSIILGGIIGLIFGEKAAVLSPLGDIFINLMFVVIVPLIFLTVTTAIIKMESPKRLGKIMSRIVIVFIIMSVISALIGVVSTYAVKLVDNKNTSSILELLDEETVIDTDLSILERTASLLTAGDFNTLLSKDSIIALLVFSIIFALAVRKSKEKGETVTKILFSLNEVVLNFVNIIMYYAPIGLGCYFATLIGTYGESIAVGFLKTFVIYTIVCVFVYVVVYSVYALIAGGKKGLKAYWKNIVPPTITALATCSSAACIPVNVKASKDVGVSDDIAETTIPMGTSFHKDGSVIGSVFKIMFLVNLFNMNPSIWTVLGVSILATLLVTAVPVGGGTISEMFIITLMGFPAGSLPILTIIATVIDAPATVLNVVGDTASSMLVGRMVDGKKFLKKNK